MNYKLSDRKNPTNKHEAANTGEGGVGRARPDFPSRSREALTSLYKAP